MWSAVVEESEGVVLRGRYNTSHTASHITLKTLSRYTLSASRISLTLTAPDNAHTKSHSIPSLLLTLKLVALAIVRQLEML